MIPKSLFLLRPYRTILLSTFHLDVPRILLAKIGQYTWVLNLSFWWLSIQASSVFSLHWQPPLTCNRLPSPSDYTIWLILIHLFVPLITPNVIPQMDWELCILFNQLGSIYAMHIITTNSWPTKLIPTVISQNMYFVQNSFRQFWYIIWFGNHWTLVTASWLVSLSLVSLPFSLFPTTKHLI